MAQVVVDLVLVLDWRVADFIQYVLCVQAVIDFFSTGQVHPLWSFFLGSSQSMFHDFKAVIIADPEDDLTVQELEACSVDVVGHESHHCVKVFLAAAAALEQGLLNNFFETNFVELRKVYD